MANLSAIITPTNVVTATGAATLTNKDLSSSTNIFPTPPQLTGTASSGSWTGTGPYTQSVTVTGLTSTASTVLDINLSGASFANVPDLLAAYGLVYRAVPGTNSITLYATAVPTTTFSIYVTVI